MQSFKLKFLLVTILQGVEFPIFLLIFEWALQQCSANALPVIYCRPIRPYSINSSTRSDRTRGRLKLR